MFSDIIPGDDYSFALATPGDDQIIFANLPQSQQDQLRNSPGINAIALLSGDDLYHDDDGSRIIFGNAGNDTIFGHGGNDTIAGGRDNDWLEVSHGDNILFGNLGDDVLIGGDGDDLMFGGQGDDVLVAGNGNDLLSGDMGNDTLIGGLGQNTLTGGAGANVFFLSRAGATLDINQADRITDFNPAKGDRIAYSAQEFSRSEFVTWSDGRISLQTGEVLAVVETGQPSFDHILPVSARNEDDWLGRVNQFRSLAGLAPVTENPTWSQGGILHSQYLVNNNVSGHVQDPNNPWYTPEGDAAGQSGNVTTSSALSRSPVNAIDGWMDAPFHAIGMIDPRLTRVGFGSYSEANGGVQSAATLDVLRGLDGGGAASYPVKWPGDGTTVPLTSYSGGEYPDPLAGSGFTAPSGLPVYLQLGSGTLTPTVTASSFRVGGVELPHIVFDETTYMNPDSTAQQLGRNVLGSRDAVVLIPQMPLEPGQTYSVSISADGMTYDWSFDVERLDPRTLVLGR